ncbi:Patatin-like phospholipase domain-containing 2 [Chlorella sorokiniana]|uniref:Patatin-like phospholipase domain-containing 2 n=1 Tax=Chlorella sorokiniana TaxID=3076 RepID=A0A2P6TNM7_CHLSO|nr:Patatin-like phospholipase domain-containing 2 [Chlorella sorokiniana]|eukprot:PRW50935.1 Patatin-like phospholipase domain-containing 2 [Chlorella sorokiniana]
MKSSTVVGAMAVLLALAGPAAAARRLAQPGGGSTDGKTPIAWFGSGLLIEYYGGVAQVLAKAGVITKDTPLSGNSGGALASAAIAMGLEFTDLIKLGGVLKSTGSPEAALSAIVPDNVASLLNGRVRMGISQLDASQPTFNGSAAWVVDSYTDKADAMSAMFATSCLPCFLVNTSFCMFRDQPVLDGGYSVSWEQLCPGGDTANCIKVSAETSTAIHLGQLSGEECAAKLDTREEAVTQLYQNDLANAAEWPLADMADRCPEAEWEGQEPYVPKATMFEAFYPVVPDIYPGKYGPLPKLNGTEIRACDWAGWTRALPKGLELEAAKAIYGQGVVDATAWLAERAKAGNKA